MVNSRRAQLDETFFALSNPTRRAILARLAQGDCSDISDAPTAADFARIEAEWQAAVIRMDTADLHVG